MTQKIVVLAVYISVFLAELPSNFLAFYSFLKKVCKKPLPIDILLLILPFKMVEVALDNTWPLPDFLCPLANFIFYSSIYLSTLFLMGISMERYLCIAYPVQHKLNCRLTYAKVASLFFWFLACSHCLSIAYGVEYYDRIAKKGSPNSTCYYNFPSSHLQIVLPIRLEVCIVLFFIPFIITLFCYISVICILTSMPNIKPQKRQWAVALALATVLNFSLAFAPYNISHTVGFIEGENPVWKVETFAFTSLNTTLDPVIFFFSSATIRQVVTDYWLHICSSARSPCCLICCKTPNANGKGEGDAQISVSNMLARSSTLTP